MNNEPRSGGAGDSAVQAYSHDGRGDPGPELVEGPPDAAEPRATDVLRIGDVRKNRPKDVVRAPLALGMSLLLLLLAATGCWGWLHGNMDTAKMQDFTLFAQLFVAPASVVLLFYFTRRK